MAATASSKAASPAGDSPGGAPQLAALGALAAFSLFLALQPVSRATSSPQSNKASIPGNAPSELAKFELDLVDDEQTPFDDLTEAELPRGGSLMSEGIDAFSAHPRSGHYLRLVPVDHETFADTARRVEPWLRQLRLPVDERVALGPYVDLDPAGKETQVGLRTYVVRTPAIITATDIEYANASRSKSDQRPVVHLRLRPSVVWRFQQATRGAVGKRWAILIDDQVESAPWIRHEIADGNLQIVMGGRGEKDMARARELSRKLFP